MRFCRITVNRRERSKLARLTMPAPFDKLFAILGNARAEKVLVCSHHEIPCYAILRRKR